jgi:hypothetical protein
MINQVFHWPLRKWRQSACHFVQHTAKRPEWINYKLRSIDGEGYVFSPDIACNREHRFWVKLFRTHVVGSAPFRTRYLKNFRTILVVKSQQPFLLYPLSQIWQVQNRIISRQRIPSREYWMVLGRNKGLLGNAHTSCADKNNGRDDGFFLL